MKNPNPKSTPSKWKIKIFVTKWMSSTRLLRPADADDTSKYDYRQLFSDAELSISPSSGENLAKEVVDLRRVNRGLEDRVKNLEVPKL